MISIVETSPSLEEKPPKNVSKTWGVSYAVRCLVPPGMSLMVQVARALKTMAKDFNVAVLVRMSVPDEWYSVWEDSFSVCRRPHLYILFVFDCWVFLSSSQGFFFLISLKFIPQSLYGSSFYLKLNLILMWTFWWNSRFKLILRWHVRGAVGVQVTNHVTRSSSGEVQPGLGATWSHVPRTRVLLERTGTSATGAGVRSATLVKSSRQVRVRNHSTRNKK